MMLYNLSKLSKISIKSARGWLSGLAVCIELNLTQAWSSDLNFWTTISTTLDLKHESYKKCTLYSINR